jgi:hypothetical protein
MSMSWSENRIPLSGSCRLIGMIWSENRIPLFGIMPAKQNGAGKLPRR